MPPSTTLDLPALWQALQAGARRRADHPGMEPFERFELPSGTKLALRMGSLGRRRLVVWRDTLAPEGEWSSDLIAIVRAFRLDKRKWEGEHWYTPSGGQQSVYTERTA